MTDINEEVMRAVTRLGQHIEEVNTLIHLSEGDTRPAAVSNWCVVVDSRVFTERGPETAGLYTIQLPSVPSWLSAAMLEQAAGQHSLLSASEVLGGFEDEDDD